MTNSDLTPILFVLLVLVALAQLSVAFDAGIISAAFYTTLVVAAVVTSQAAGAWLEFLLRKGWPLLTPMGDVEASALSATQLSVK